jgi:hypothetical protein
VVNGGLGDLATLGRIALKAPYGGNDRRGLLG